MGYRISRRKFLKLSALTFGGAATIECLQALLASQGINSVAADSTLQTSFNDLIVPGVCLMCSGGCGTLARVAGGHVVKLEGNPMHPVNLGTLCPKGQAAPELLYNPDRLSGPIQRVGERGSGKWQPVTWNAATQLVAQKLNTLRSTGHPERAVLMHGETRGQLRSFFDRFMQAVGSPNLISKESLNTEAAKLGNTFTQGLYELPAYDLENTNYLISFGASLLEAGRVPVRTIMGYSTMRRGRATRGKLVVIDPRQGVTGAKADEWISIIPGTDAALALGMANVIIQSGMFDSDFVNNYGFGFEDFNDEAGHLHTGFKSYVLEHYTPSKVEQITGVPATTISRLAGEFAQNKPGLAILPAKGGLLNGTIGGIYTAMAVQILNALVGSIEKPGGVMTQRYPATPAWPSLPVDAIAEKGLKAERVDGAGTQYPLSHHAYQAVADRILAGNPVEVLFLYDANPVYEVPGGKRFVEAFNKIPFIISFSSFMDESAQYVDLVLPEPTFLERYEDDYIEGLGYPGIALRQPAIPPRLNTQNVGDFFLKLAGAMGGSIKEAFPWTTYEEVLQFRLKDVGTDWKTLKDLGVWMTPGYHFSLRGSDRWVSEVIGRDRRFSPADGRFDFYSRELNSLLENFNPDQLKALGVSQTGDAARFPHYEPTPFSGKVEDYPFVLNVITLMSLGSTSAAANLPTLQEISGMTVGETWDSWLEMSPGAATVQGLNDKDQVWVESPFGKVKTKVRLVKGLRPDVVNIPYNQGHTAVGRWAKGRGVNGMDLLNPASEPAAGLAEFSNTRVKVYRA
jgi:menaquinone reductase, molybdopterin-binding-like subunit